ncbi:uncharacterized protein TNCV_1292431 [Trichonephila clavipes]|nr:uncharacterized protein TNCV_1292431 [Trichonephila clavipes]
MAQTHRSSQTPKLMTGTVRNQCQRSNCKFNENNAVIYENSSSVAHACRRRRLKGVPSVRGIAGYPTPGEIRNKDVVFVTPIDRTIYGLRPLLVLAAHVRCTRCTPARISPVVTTCTVYEYVFEQCDVQQLLRVRPKVTGKLRSGFQECDEEDVETCMACDAEECGFKILNDDEIVTSVQEESDSVDDEKDEVEDNNNESSKNPS